MSTENNVDFNLTVKPTGRRPGGSDRGPSTIRSIYDNLKNFRGVGDGIEVRLDSSNNQIIILGSLPRPAYTSFMRRLENLHSRSVRHRFPFNFTNNLPESPTVSTQIYSAEQAEIDSLNDQLDEKQAVIDDLQQTMDEDLTDLISGEATLQQNTNLLRMSSHDREIAVLTNFANRLAATEEKHPDMYSPRSTVLDGLSELVTSLNLTPQGTSAGDLRETVLTVSSQKLEDMYDAENSDSHAEYAEAQEKIQPILADMETVGKIESDDIRLPALENLVSKRKPLADIIEEYELLRSIYVEEWKERINTSLERSEDDEFTNFGMEIMLELESENIPVYLHRKSSGKNQEFDIYFPVLNQNTDENSSPLPNLLIDSTALSEVISNMTGQEGDYVSTIEDSDLVGFRVTVHSSDVGIGDAIDTALQTGYNSTSLSLLGIGVDVAGGLFIKHSSEITDSSEIGAVTRRANELWILKKAGEAGLTSPQIDQELRSENYNISVSARAVQQDLLMLGVEGMIGRNERDGEAALWYVNPALEPRFNSVEDIVEHISSSRKSQAPMNKRYRSILEFVDAQGKDYPGQTQVLWGAAEALQHSVNYYTLRNDITTLIERKVLYTEDRKLSIGNNVGRFRQAYLREALPKIIDDHEQGIAVPELTSSADPLSPVEVEQQHVRYTLKMLLEEPDVTFRKVGSRYVPLSPSKKHITEDSNDSTAEVAPIRGMVMTKTVKTAENEPHQELTPPDTVANNGAVHDSERTLAETIEAYAGYGGSAFNNIVAYAQSFEERLRLVKINPPTGKAYFPGVRDGNLRLPRDRNNIRDISKSEVAETLSIVHDMLTERVVALQAGSSPLPASVQDITGIFEKYAIFQAFQNLQPNTNPLNEPT